MFKQLRFISILSLLATFVLSFPIEARAGLWATGYYAGWMQSYLPPSAIDLSALTDVIHFSVLPNADGSLDADTNSLSAANSADLVSRAHASNVRVLVSVGGENTAPAFRSATSSANLSRFVANLVAFATSRGYDGIDIDWEPLATSDAAQYSALVNALRAALDGVTPRPLLTAAVAGEPALVASLQDSFDQVNLMSYALSAPWPGWVSWFDSPIYDGGYRFPSTDAPVPSIDGTVNEFLVAGVDAQKLGIGMSFYGTVWSGGSGAPTGGVTAPRQGWTTAPTAYGLPYYSIIDNFAPSYRYAWDGAAQAAYLSLDDANPANDRFVSYDDETAARSKVEYARAKGIGGVMIWELGGGYRANQPAGSRDPLLQSVKQALALAAPAATVVPTLVPATPPPATPTPTPTPLPTAMPTPTPAGGSDLWIYRDGIVAPWINASWGATLLDVVSTLLGSTRVLQVAEIGWGALSLHSGAWDATQAIDPSRYKAVEFMAYSALPGFKVGVRLENDAKATFPLATPMTIPAGRWTKISVSMKVLNPLGRPFDRLDIKDANGITRTFLVDDIRFVAKVTTPTPTATPRPATPTPTATRTPTPNPPTPTPTRTPTLPLPTPTRTPTSSPTPMPTATPATTADLWLFQDALLSPWMNASWSAAVDFAATSPVFAGTRSLQVAATGWGALSLHSGNWGATQSLDPRVYQSVEFRVYSATSFNLAVQLENDARAVFPRLSAGTIPASAWTKVSLPLASLDPSALAFDRLDLSDWSGTNRTFYVDDVRFVGAGSAPTPTATSVLPSPTNTPTPPVVPSPTATVAIVPPAPTAIPTTMATATPRPPTPTPTATPTPSGELLQDTFAGTDGLITSYQYYSSANFPLGGISLSSNPSPLWEGDSGSLYRQSGWGYSGRPIDWGNKYFYRFNTRNFAIGDATISWTYRSAPYGEDGYAVEGSDAVDVWLRYQTQYNVYAFQFDRTNDCVQAKRKIPAQGWSGPSNLIANKGVYYSLPTDAQQPLFGAGSYCVSWAGVQNLLPTSERTKPRFPALAHDGVTPYDFRVSVRNVGANVQIQAWRAGVLVYSATDDGRSGIAANGETQGTHIDRGYYNSVPGWQPSWGRPITAPGASGFRADNIKFWLRDFLVSP